MKHIKTLGLAVVAVLALAALASAATASASELCSTNTSPCTGTVYGKGTVIEAESSKAELQTEGGLVNPKVTCTESKTSGKTTSAGGVGKAVSGSIESLSFNKCTNNINGGACEATAVGLPYAASATANSPSDGNGSFTVSNLTVTFLCLTLPKPNHCSYVASSVTLSFVGNTPAHLVANAVALTLDTAAGASEFGCPPRESWTATYTVSKPAPAYLVNP